MNYFYFFFFLLLATLILIKPVTIIIYDWVMRSEKLTKTGLLWGFIGILLVYIGLLDSFWHERMWMVVTFILGILLIIRSIFIILFLNQIKRALKRGDGVELRNFGTFRIKTQKASIRRNPKTGEKVAVPEKKVISWKMSKEMFKNINNEE